MKKIEFFIYYYINIIIKMCGIFVIINYKQTGKTIDELLEYANKIKHRGPDNTQYIIIDNILFVFHRLAIIDSLCVSNQPFVYNDVYLVCNGEIYNHKELIKKYDLEMNTTSDCEVILQLYCKLGHDNLKKIYNELHGEFAFVLYDRNNDKIFIGRDSFGVRPLFFGKLNNNVIGFASEAKSLLFLRNIQQFQTNTYSHFNISEKLCSFCLATYFEKIKNTLSYCVCDNFVLPIVGKTNYYLFNKDYIENIQSNINILLTDAVKMRVLNTDKKIGAFLSGGLDSSLIVAIATRFCDDIECFSVGMKDSADIYYAKIVAKHFNIKHHVIEFTFEEAFTIIDELIYQLETYCVTTIRASIGQYILSKYIKNNTNIKVLLSGEGSDELFSGYRYNLNCPDTQELFADELYRLENIQYYDGLRADRTVSGCGLELRVPFLDKTLIDYVLAINPELKMSSREVIEKKILRDSFKTYLPDEILYRRKVAFSDGVAKKGESLYKQIAHKINIIISDDEFENHTYKINPPKTKEALYYRNIFNKYYKKCDDIIPDGSWMPSWQDPSLTDPSATALSNYIEYD